jgi:hypothetical protein
VRIPNINNVPPIIQSSTCLCTYRNFSNTTVTGGDKSHKHSLKSNNHTVKLSRSNTKPAENQYTSQNKASTPYSPNSFSSLESNTISNSNSVDTLTTENDEANTQPPSRFNRRSKLFRKSSFDNETIDFKDFEENQRPATGVTASSPAAAGGVSAKADSESQLPGLSFRDMFRYGNGGRPVVYKTLIDIIKHPSVKAELVEYVVSSMEEFVRHAPLDRLELEAMSLALCIHANVERGWLVTLALKSKYELSRTFRDRLMEELKRRGETRYVARLKLFKVVDDPPRSDSRPRPAFCLPKKPSSKPRYFSKSDRFRYNDLYIGGQ